MPIVLFCHLLKINDICNLAPTYRTVHFRSSLTGVWLYDYLQPPPRHQRRAWDRYSQDQIGHYQTHWRYGWSTQECQIHRFLLLRESITSISGSATNSFSFFRTFFKTESRWRANKSRNSSVISRFPFLVFLSWHTETKRYIFWIS